MSADNDTDLLRFPSVERKDMSKLEGAMVDESVKASLDPRGIPYSFGNRAERRRYRVKGV